MKNFHFIPAESFTVNGKMHGETFIWCNAYYNPLNDILAVDGCLWADLYGVVLVDFTNPMSETLQVDTRDYFKCDSEDFDGIDFIAWDGTDLVLGASVNGADLVRVTVTQEEYSSWLKNRA